MSYLQQHLGASLQSFVDDRLGAHGDRNPALSEACSQLGSARYKREVRVNQSPWQARKGLLELEDDVRRNAN